MDEPLSNLDAKLRVQTRAEIARLHQRLQTTIVYVTHDQVEAMTMGSRIAVMNAGLLQQVGTPQRLYEHPVNKFVAGFIGSPSMNFVTVRTDRVGDKVVLHDGAFTVTVPDRLRDVVGPALGRSLTMGIRPEHLEIGEAGDGAASVRTTVDVVEFLGNEELLHLRAGDHDLLALVDARHRVRPGDVLDLSMPLDQVHLFDDASGDALGEIHAATAS
jgi:multiple sugar transport system ATP-binding protein